MNYQANYVFHYEDGTQPMDEPVDILADSDDDAVGMAKERVENWNNYNDVPVELVSVCRCNEYWDEVKQIY